MGVVLGSARVSRGCGEEGDKVVEERAMGRRGEKRRGTNR